MVFSLKKKAQGQLYPYHVTYPHLAA